MKKIVIGKNDANLKIDKYLKKLLVNAPANFIYKMLRNKDVKVNGKRVNDKYIVQEHDEVDLFLYEDKFIEFTKAKTIYDLPITFTVLYEDENILIVNKPVGLLVHEDYQESVNTLANQVLCYLAKKGEYDTSRENSFIPGPVHRLDRNTSGIVIFGKTLTALQTLNEMIKQRHCIEKRYQTIVKGQMTKPVELMDYMVKLPDEPRVKLVGQNYPGALTMKTKVYPIAANPQFSLVEVLLVTGRMHQIRVHLASINHPIIGDKKYGDFALNKEMKQRLHLQYQLLHAYKVTFVKALGSLAYLQDKEIVSPLPQEFLKIKEILL